MFEFIVFLAFPAFLGALGLLLLKILFGLLVLPFRVAFWLARGLVGILLAGLLVFVFFNFFSFALPFLILFFLLPVLLVGALFVYLIRLVF